MMWWNYADWGVGTWVTMSLMMLVFWTLIIGLILWAARSTSDKPSATAIDQRQAASADDVLAERFARGEITEGEFVRRRGLLNGSDASSRLPADLKGNPSRTR